MKKKVIKPSEHRVKNIPVADDSYIKSTLANLQKKIESTSWKAFEKERKLFSKEWQFINPAWVAIPDRYELDKDAYCEYYFSEDHSQGIGFDEKILIDTLLTNLKKAKTPYFISYRNFLEKKLNSISKETLPDVQLKGIATYLFFKTGFNAPGKNNAPAWQKILSEIGCERLKGSSLGKTYNDLSKVSNRKGHLSEKVFLDATRLFNSFPDAIGLEKLNNEMKK